MEFCLRPENPLTFYSAKMGIYLQPDRHAIRTDFGSVPECLQGIVSNTFCVASFILHDCACNPTEHCLYSSPTLDHAGIPYDRMPMDSATAAGILCEASYAERGCWWKSQGIWFAVRYFGPQFETRRLTPPPDAAGM